MYWLMRDAPIIYFIYRVTVPAGDSFIGCAWYWYGSDDALPMSGKGYPISGSRLSPVLKDLAVQHGISNLSWVVLHASRDRRTAVGLLRTCVQEDVRMNPKGNHNLAKGKRAQGLPGIRAGMAERVLSVLLAKDETVTNLATRFGCTDSTIRDTIGHLRQRNVPIKSLGKLRFGLRSDGPGERAA